MNPPLDDAQTIQLVLQKGILSEKDLAPFRAQCAADPSTSLFDLLTAQGLLRHDHLIGIPSTPKPAARNTVSGRLRGGATLLRRGSSEGEPQGGVAQQSAPQLGVQPSLAPDPRISVGLGSKPPLGRPVPPKAVGTPLSKAMHTPPQNPQGGVQQGASVSTHPQPPHQVAVLPPRPSGAIPGTAADRAAVPTPPPANPVRNRKFEFDAQQSAQRGPAAAAGPAGIPAQRPPMNSFQQDAVAPQSGAVAGMQRGVAAPHAGVVGQPPMQPPPQPPPQPQPQHSPQHSPQPQPHAEPGKGEKEEVPAGWPGGVAPEDPDPRGIQAYLKAARKANASDFHLSVGLPPMVRVASGLKPLIANHPPLTAEHTKGLIRMMLTPQQWAYFDRLGDLDGSYCFQSGGRFRINCMKQRNGMDMACRIIEERIRTLDDLGLPQQAKRLTEFAQGLVLVTGPSGHGKTTTMMALVEMVNVSRSDHIITVEDPIEYILAGKSCQVTQREVGPHTKSFATALKAALREDPDIIVIGELRDYDTTSMAINASETGHLVFSSMPTQDCCKTVDKLIDIFPPEEQEQIRLMVSESLRGIVSQQLVPTKDGTGRVAAVELLFNSVAVSNIIRDANTPGLVNAMQLGKNKGMVLMDDALLALVEKGIVAGEEAWLRATNKLKFTQWAPKV